MHRNESYKLQYFFYIKEVIHNQALYLSVLLFIACIDCCGGRFLYFLPRVKCIGVNSGVVIIISIAMNCITVCICIIGIVIDIGGILLQIHGALLNNHIEVIVFIKVVRL